MNSLFGLVAMVHVKWDFLMFAFPYLGDCLGVCRTGFIVDDLQVNVDPTCCKASHDGVVGWDLVMVRFSLEGLHQNDIGRIMICEHDVFIATHCADWESPQIIGDQC
jgi:hypothetical protein